MPTWTGSEEQVDLILSKEVGEVWFKRRPYIGGNAPVSRPKRWHALTSRQLEEGRNIYYIWEAACGYRYRIAEIIQSLTFRTSKPKDRYLTCPNCVRQLNNS